MNKSIQPTSQTVTLEFCPRCYVRGGFKSLLSNSYGEPYCQMCGTLYLGSISLGPDGMRDVKPRNKPRFTLNPQQRVERDKEIGTMAKQGKPAYLIADRTGLSLSCTRRKIAEARR